MNRYASTMSSGRGRELDEFGIAQEVEVHLDAGKPRGPRPEVVAELGVDGRPPIFRLSVGSVVTASA